MAKRAVRTALGLAAVLMAVSVVAGQVGGGAGPVRPMPGPGPVVKPLPVVVPASQPEGVGWVAVCANTAFYQQDKRPEVSLAGQIGFKDPGVSGRVGPTGGYFIQPAAGRSLYLGLGVNGYNMRPYVGKQAEVKGKIGDERIAMVANTIEVGWIRLAHPTSQPASQP